MLLFADEEIVQTVQENRKKESKIWQKIDKDFGEEETKARFSGCRQTKCAKVGLNSRSRLERKEDQLLSVRGEQERELLYRERCNYKFLKV